MKTNRLGYFKNLLWSTSLGYKHLGDAASDRIKNNYYDRFARKQGYSGFQKSAFHKMPGGLTLKERAQYLKGRSGKDQKIVKAAQKGLAWTWVKAKAAVVGTVMSFIGGITGFTAALVGSEYMGAKAS